MSILNKSDVKSSRVFQDSNVDEFCGISGSSSFWFIFIRVCLWFFSWVQLEFLFRSSCFKILVIFVMIIMQFSALRAWSLWSASAWCSEFTDDLHKTLQSVTSSCCSLIWSSKMQSSGQISCWLRMSSHMLWKSNHFLPRMRSCLPRSRMSMRMSSWHHSSTWRCSTMAWVTAGPGLPSYPVTETGVLRQVTVMLRNLAASMTQKVLMKIRSFAPESVRAFNEISNSFLAIWHDKIKLFPPNNWQRSIRHRLISSTLSRKKTWPKIPLLPVPLLDPAFAPPRIWAQ